MSHSGNEPDVLAMSARRFNWKSAQARMTDKCFSPGHSGTCWSCFRRILWKQTASKMSSSVLSPVVTLGRLDVASSQNRSETTG